MAPGWPSTSFTGDRTTSPCIDSPGNTSTFAEVIAETWTDAVVVLHDGQIVLEEYLNGMTAEDPHLLMSVTKSVVGCIAGILVDQGLLDPDVQASSYVPEIVGLGL